MGTINSVHKFDAMSDIASAKYKQTNRNYWLICKHVIDSISKSKIPAHGASYTYSWIFEQLNDFSYEEKDFDLAMIKLCGMPFQLLKIEYEYVDDEDDSYFLRSSVIQEAERLGGLVHPEKAGVIDKNFLENTFLVFKLRDCERLGND